MDTTETQTPGTAPGLSALDKDRVFAAGTALLAMYLGYESFGYPAGSSFFPRTLSVVMGLLALVLFVRLTRKKKRSAPARAGFGEERLSLKSAGLVFGSITAYGLLMAVINYEAASILFLATMMAGLGFRRPLAVAGLSVGLMLLLYTIFFKLLGVSRPESLFFQG